MYDLEIVLSVCAKSIENFGDAKKPVDYKQRFFDFKKYGLLNIKDHKILVKLLICEDDKLTTEELNTGWADGIDIEIVLCPLRHPVCKTYYYYSNLENCDHAHWFAKVDDDSTTDIDGLLKNLELNFDINREYYICTDLRNEIHEIEKKILIEMNYHHWFNQDSKGIYHEWEMAIISQPAIKRIISNTDSKTLMLKRSLIPDGFTDQCLSIAARIAKIYPCAADFITQYPILHNYSILGGNLNHIHYFSYDLKYHLYDFFRKSIDGNCKIWGKLKDKKYLFYNNNNNIPISIFEFEENGKLLGTNPNETFWFYENNLIHFCNKDLVPTTILTIKDENFNNMEGEFLLDKNIIHKVIKIKENDV